MKKSVNFSRMIENGKVRDSGDVPLNGGRSKNHADMMATIPFNIMFIMISLIMVVILIEALTSWTSTNEFVRLNGERITASLQEISTDSTHSAKEFDKLSFYVSQMEMKNKGVLDASAISFLFEVFAIALVTAGIYLLSWAHRDFIRVRRQAHQSMEEARQLQNTTKGLIHQARHNDQLIASYENSLALSDLFWHAYALSNLVITRKFKREPLYSGLRETGRQIDDLLAEAKSEKTGIAPNTHASLLDRITRIRETLKSISCPREILGLYLKIEGTLKDKQYIQDYHEHKSSPK